MRLKFTSIILFLLPCCLAYSQSIERSTISSATGSHANNGAIQIQSNIGELMVETYTGTSTVFSQGFDQPELPFFVSVVNYDQIEGGVVFPNPVSKKLFIRLNWSNISDVVIEVYDVLGKKQEVSVLQGQFAQNSSFELDFENVENGIYFIHVVASNKQMNEVFKINKCE